MPCLAEMMRKRCPYVLKINTVNVHQYQHLLLEQTKVCVFVFLRLTRLVKASASRAEDPGFESRLRRDFFRCRVIPVT